MSEKTHLSKTYKNILISETENPGALKVGLIQLNRPDVLNALNIELMIEVVEALESFDKDNEIGCMVLTGSAKAFAAGADIKEMAEATAIEMLVRDQFARWDRIRKIKKPIIAAVSGFALGGGCELAMTCDIIIAAESAKFGQPEINLGVIPGAGGTQRLTKAIGKARAMEMILTGKMFGAKEMFEAGLVTKVVDSDIYLDEALELAREIASKPTIAVQLAKECVLKSFDSTIESGLEFERKNFYLLFASEDKFEGMKAFVEKRKAEWKGK
ncbi:MAG TPA: enoyl-CoA hydratase-related protein [Ignavibacteria bacterium]|nr:enoyl-CoA hydratase-related protein [Ignavibacteria bacterium]HMR39743.1 enoyl-CoA hydratase-related protein [Ignavibacteria bacterium]